ncbi:TPA: toll/interleukin-1 receptor domain-containing protein [Salmonella enterica]|uniref:Toll/interleukin-1 receptor domain-containing protein n=2 Tax=Salmonella enterica TaxID=28901 RepID=A0A749FV46_SALER|nr:MULTISPECIES: toll/interleukin-1 receptor domain-containing protein [Enterobacteriaceae]EAA4050451.1 toll/interleukin-1 receptor domain-containing protein [Salmonella enterica subsp. enterica serovar Java]EAQ0534945.1 toll/interleukin-1 receptor domain-containing protein [Salmonella enterica]EBL5775977.1 toll/interleukin-1 receptor domain-containing protein [Salmonella enterica subsp. enterica serovar Virchow]ECI5366477.1 toll/interleukin-1 receptor domain-containing protein [Salmonella ente
MSEKMIFLSHITEEKELARIVKDAIEDEFSGFVRVFVSSDGETIKAGQNFLKVIEDGLVECIAAIYLISPVSVQRSWISFELGAVWVRNALSQRNNGPEIPALPFCHSGMSFKELPQPICNLNAIEANLASKLEFAFRSLQSSVGGKGRLKTDFDALASQIVEFERKYTLFDKVKEVLALIGLREQDRSEFINRIKTPGMSHITIQTHTTEDKTKRVFDIIDNYLSEFATYKVKSSGIQMGDRGSSNFSEYGVTFQTSILQEALTS